MSLPGRPPKQDFITLTLAGISVPSPGLAVVKNAGSPRNWDVRQGYGLTGASLVFMGKGLSEFDVDIFLWTDDQWLLWEGFSALLTLPPAPPGVMPTSLSIGHPILNAKPWLIDKVVVKDVSSWEQDDTGLWSTTIKFIEYRKPKPALLKPLEGPPSKDTPVRPRDPAEEMIAKLDADNAALRAKL